MAFSGLEGPFSENHALVMLCRQVDEELKPNFYNLSYDLVVFVLACLVLFWQVLTCCHNLALVFR